MPNVTKIINIKDKNSLLESAKVLKRGGVLVFPTDTVYGIGCLLDEKAIKKLYRIKNRTQSQPTAVLMTTKIFFIHLKNEKETIESVLSDYPAGCITMVFVKESIDVDFPNIIIKNNKIGIRLPRHKWLEKLIGLVGPIVASSANKKGEPAPSKFEEMSDEILEQADLVIRTDTKLRGIPSHIIDIETKKVLR